MPAHHNLEEYFFEHPRGMAGSWSLAVIDLAGRRRKLSSWMSAWGLAWSAAGDEIWFTASGTGMQAELQPAKAVGERSYFPGTHALQESGPSDAVSPLGNLERTAYLIRSGRAVVAPVYFAMYERKKGPLERPAATSVAMRDTFVNCYKDLARTVDYLETRPDIDRSRIAYYGVSLGGVMGSVYTAQEPRFRTAVFVSGALGNTPWPPEIDPLNFASRSRTPVLMLNGRYDFAFTVEGCQRPLFRMLGVAEKDKRYVLFDSGHDLPAAPMMKEVLEWLDRYLGPVQSGP